MSSATSITQGPRDTNGLCLQLPPQIISHGRQVDPGVVKMNRQGTAVPAQ